MNTTLQNITPWHKSTQHISRRPLTGKTVLVLDPRGWQQVPDFTDGSVADQQLLDYRSTHRSNFCESYNMYNNV